MENRFDRIAEDVGNILALEHVNIHVPDQHVATIFYVMGMGLTRDPYRSAGIKNMWINVGRSQFHLPTGNPDVLRGHVGLVLADREALLARLASVKGELDDTLFDFIEHDDYVEVTSPWGNRLRCFEPDKRFGPITLGISYVEFAVPMGTAPAIARFYREILATMATTNDDAEGRFADCLVGRHQHFIFRETDRPLGRYDGDHVAIYVADFSGPHDRLATRGLISQESNRWQYRFVDISDLETGDIVFKMEHEVRAMTHPQFMRPLVNRDPELPPDGFPIGHEEYRWTSPYGE